MGSQRELTLDEWESLVTEAMSRVRRRMQGCSARWWVSWGHLLDGAIEEVLEERERCGGYSKPRAGG